MSKPRSKSNSSTEDDNETSAAAAHGLRERKRPSYKEDDLSNTASDDDDDGQTDEFMIGSNINNGSSTDPADEDLPDDLESEDEEDGVACRRSRRRRQQRRPMNMDDARKENNNNRRSGRANKFTSSMAEPTASLKDLFARKMDSDDDDESEEEVVAKKKKKNTKSRAAQQQQQQRGRNNNNTRGGGGGRNRRAVAITARNNSPHKSPARRHAQRRRSLKEDNIATPAAESSSSEASIPSSDEEEEEEFDDESVEEEEEEEESEPLKPQRIIACRTETKQRWKEIVKCMTTSEITYGSRWFQEEDWDKNEEEETPEAAAASAAAAFEERFLVKWSDLSFLHASWETQRDLVEQCDAKVYLSTFFRKNINGLLYSQDERCDGDYFDPAYCEIDRILEVTLPEDYEDTDLTPENEDKFDEKSFGMIMDKSDPEFDNGTGRQFLIKWCHSGYTESTYEFERDLIVNDIDYKEQLKLFLRRNEKPTDRKSKLKKGLEERKHLYAFLGDKSNKMSESDREAAVDEYKKGLQEEVYKNGGQLRDYQAEGVAWMISNFVNQRSCVLSDEMGLGKTLQTAALVNILATKLNTGWPALIVAPLSTLAHWYREFTQWTDLNAIIYHGSADDRRLIRQHEFVYECDRPQTALGFNQLYLKKCVQKKNRADSPWMVDVVITSPEMMVSDDTAELAAVKWDVLVVDEAHRLKNHTSKLSVGLRDDKFSFGQKLLLTGTPIQNDILEFWTLLNFIDPESFADAEYFDERYGDMKSKERVDEMHEEIRPYILRRLKEDVEKSVPPKEETLIEVELTVSQKQYYRALYEKNVKFLHKNKKKALDGPSLNNLAMQLRKCCNHLFLLNGVEEEYRKKQLDGMSEGDFLTNASGKLVLLDKLLPRLKEQGHRLLLFSQFKIMLDVLEDYLNSRCFKFERIDGSITGHKRQQAIDRFQAPEEEGKEPPFVMMLSTRAGGVGINLTAADTVVIFDSDWNPQNDLQAQARCHRIGQTKSVKVYRLMTRKTYEMQMFHMSSLKMGLDQAVLKGFESGTSGEGALSKEEVEKLLRHGAYDIFNEEKSGDADKESNDFVQQDIDSILERRARTVIHENTGSKSDAAGGTFSKASFKARPSDPNGKGKDDDIDIEDPDFWKKMIGEGVDDKDDDLATGPRQRTQVNYSQHQYKEELEALLQSDDGGDGSDLSNGEDEDEDDDADETLERLRWGGNAPSEWAKDDAESIVKGLSAYGYGISSWDEFTKRLELSKPYAEDEVKRLCWTVVLATLLDVSKDDGEAARKREEKAAGKAQEKAQEESKPKDGGILAANRPAKVTVPDVEEFKQKAFAKLLAHTSEWMVDVISDALAYASSNSAREPDQVNRALRKTDRDKKPAKGADLAAMFATSVWPSLKGRGWKAEVSTEGDSAGKTRYSYGEKEYLTPEAVLKAASSLHPELDNAIDNLLASAEADRQETLQSQVKAKEMDLALSLETITLDNTVSFLERYSPAQFLCNRTKTSSRMRLPRRILFHGTLLFKASTLVRKASETTPNDGNSIDQLVKSLLLAVDKKTAPPHPLWTARHDSILIHAIAKHGWIDHDACARAIAEDPMVKWGPPFDAAVGEDCSVVDKAAAGAADQIMATAKQAAIFLNRNADVIAELKTFDQDRIIRTYGLILPKQEQGHQTSGSRTWEVGPSFTPLVGATQSDDKEVELPPKKDLVKRAKKLLSKATAKEKPQDSKIVPSHNYTELDQRDAANVFLAELLRGLLKAPTTAKHRRKMCCFAADEALRRARSLASLASSSVDSELSGTADELTRVFQHVEEVKRNLTRTTQYKNVLRVVLGEEPQKSRKEGDGLFPPKREFATLETTASILTERFKPTAIALKITGKQPTGEKAILLARKRYHDRYNGSNGKAGAADKDLLELTEIETLILSAAVMFGIPVWSNDWATRFGNGSDSMESPDATWSSFGKFVAELAASSLLRVGEKLNKERRDFENGRDKTPEARGTMTAAFEAAKKEYVGSELVVTQANDYANEPETLAKKAIMLIAKVREHMTKLRLSANPPHKSDSGLGFVVLNWLGEQVTRWATSLDLLDDNDRPLAFTAVEFLDELPESDRAQIEISSVLDKKGCRQVIGQISLLSRLRSLFATYSEMSLSERIEIAARDSGDEWDKKPDNWTLAADGVLLRRIMVNGLTDELVRSKEESSVVNSFSKLGLSKGSLQLRANALTRELQALESQAEFLRRIEEQNRVSDPKESSPKKRPSPADGSSDSKKARVSPPPPPPHETIDLT